MCENSTTPLDTLSCENDICRAANYIWMIISPVLLVCGLFGGLLVAIVLIRMKFQKTPLLFFLFTLTITDMIILCVGLLRLWILETWRIDIRHLSDAGCKLLHFFVYFLMQFSSWILVCVTVERFVKCRYMTYSSMVTVKKCKTTLFVVFVVLGILNSHYFWTHGFILSEYNTTVCGVLPEYKTFDEWYIKIDFLILSVIPFCIMVSLDVLILRILKNARTFRKTSLATPHIYNKLKTVDKRLTKMLLITNSYFLLSTLPVSVLFILTIYICIEQEPVNSIFSLIGSIVYTLQYSNYAVSYIFYTVCDKRIRRQLKKILRATKPRFRSNESQYTMDSCSTELHTVSSTVSTKSVSQN